MRTQQWWDGSVGSCPQAPSFVTEGMGSVCFAPSHGLSPLPYPSCHAQQCSKVFLRFVTPPPHFLFPPPKIKWEHGEHSEPFEENLQSSDLFKAPV